MHHTSGGVWSEIARAVFDILPCPEYSRKMFVLDDNPRIRFVIFKHHIIARFMLFNQIVFQQPSINLGINNGKSNTVDFPYQYPCLTVQLMVIDKIGTDPITQVFGLTNINELVVFIKILIYSRLMRDFLQLLPIIERRHRKSSNS